jgi:dipeptidyl-peptidase 4
MRLTIADSSAEALSSVFGPAETHSAMPRPPRFPQHPLLLSIGMLAVLLLPADASAVSIEQALARASSHQGRLNRDRVQPRWLEGGQRFWYELSLERGVREFVLVDAVTGEIRRGADLASLELPPRAPLKTSAIPLNLRPTQRTGDAVRIEFLNTLDHPVHLFWVDSENQRRPYGELAAGARREQGTYDGHVWLVADSEGQPLAVVETSWRHTRIEIDGRTPAAESPRQRPREGWPSPDGAWTVRIAAHNAILTRLSDGWEVSLTNDGSADHPYRGPASWSPDATSFVLMQVKETPRRHITLVESAPTDQVQPKRREVPYAKPGDALPEVRPVLFRLNREEEPPMQRIPVSADLFPQAFNEWGRLNFRWMEDSSEFVFDYNQRGHQLYRIIAVHGLTGETRAVVEETSEAFIDYTNKTWRHWLPESRQLVWMSERDGWNHLWLYEARTGQPLRQITRGHWVVRSVERVDAARGEIWFLASGLRPGEDPYHLHLCRINLDGSGFVQLTQADGNHRIEWSPDHRWFVATWSRTDHPPVTELRRSSDGHLVATLERSSVQALLDNGWSMPERFVAKGRDGTTEIHGIIVRPHPFDPTKLYPVVEEIYAGPHGAFVPKSFSVLERMQALAQLGFVAVQADGMGTNHRGREFHRIAWKNLKDAGFPDRIAWLQAAATERPWMDLSRVGIYGGSAGGQTAMRALLDHHDFYQAAAADCGCHDNRMDKIWWNEQWLGWPVDESYVANSNVEDAGKLRGALLLTVGELDTNVDPASTLQVVDRLIKANLPFEFILFPGGGHGAGGSPYGTRRRLDFFLRHLGEPRNP